LIIQGGATQVERGGLRVVAGGAVVEAVNASRDPMAFQEECLRAFEASQVARGFSELTIVNGGGTLQRFLDACGSPAWEVTPEDIDRVVGEFASQGLAASTRRVYVQAFKNFHAFLSVRKAAEIEAAFGIRLENPVDEFNAARHVSADSPSAEPPPAPERLEDFFGFLKERIAGARKYAVAGRDYALFRTLYLAGLRADEAAMMDRADVHFSRGPFGKLHVRFGKGAKTSGPRPRWVPMLDGLDLILRVSRRDPASDGRRPGPVLRRGRRPDPPRHDPQPAVQPAGDGAGGSAGPRRARRDGTIQPAHPQARLRDSQLRAGRGPGRDPADARALACRDHDAVPHRRPGNCI
jgi:integrase